MAFDQTKFIPLSAMANSSAPRTYLYTEDTDSVATVTTANYFLSAYQVLNAYDTIIVNDGAGWVYTLIVTASSASAVTVVQKKQQDIAATTAGTAVTPGVEFVALTNTAAGAVTIADSKKHQGFFGVKKVGGSTAATTVTMTAGTWDGTNTIATLNAAKEALFVWIDNDGAGTIVENVGTVGLS